MKAPASTPDDVNLFRERLALWAASFTLLSITASIATSVVGVAVLGRTWGDQLAHPGNRVGLLAPLPLAAVWTICRFGRPSRRLLGLLDVVGTFSFCLSWALMSYFAPSAAHPGLDLGDPPSPNPPIGAFANMATLYLRAALVPGTARRTLWVSCLSSAPIVVVAFLVWRAHPTVQAASFALGSTLLTLWTVPGPAIVSWVIYTLRRQVLEAQQLGQYTLEDKIGEGGMGVVYRARHALLRRPTAIKLLRPERAGVLALARFEREVQQTSRLTHPNTVAIYDYGHTADRIFYYAMEYLDGVSLEELVQHDGPQPPGRVVHILRQACAALAEAHGQGLIHRDVKPANLHLCVRGGIPDHVKVLDFGLVKEISQGTDDDGGSGTGSFVGTPLYLSPEAIVSPAAIDARADLYGLGAVAYFLLTGVPPFHGGTVVEICGHHLHTTPEPPSRRLGRALPAALEALVLRCLSKLPEHRPATAAALGRALADCPEVTAWSDSDAAGWWQERGSAVGTAASRRREAGPATAASPHRTVAVDLDHRG
jgi:eukaryotic-like serine/threonine-protein kinase